MSNLTGMTRIFQYDGDHLHAMRATNFTMTESPTFSEDKAYVGITEADCNPKVDVDVSLKETSFNCTVDTGSVDQQTMDWIWFDNKLHEEASITLPQYKSGIITGGEIADPDLTADQAVRATILSDNKPGDYPLTLVVGGASTAIDNFGVATGSMNFDTNHNGKRIIYSYLKTSTNVKIIGATQLNPHENIMISTVLCTTRTNGVKLVLPRCRSLSGLNIDASSDSFTREYKALVPTELGWVLPYAAANFQIPVVA